MKRKVQFGESEKRDIKPVLFHPIDQCFLPQGVVFVREGIHIRGEILIGVVEGVIPIGIRRVEVKCGTSDGAEELRLAMSQAHEGVWHGFVGTVFQYLATELPMVL